MEKSDCVGKLISQGHHSDIIQNMHGDTRSDIAIATVIINFIFASNTISPWYTMHVLNFVL